MRLYIAGILAGFLVAGCGSSSSDSTTGDGTTTTGVGYYLDSAVAGVAFTCGSENNITDADGKFTFEKGKDCTFELAGIPLRQVNAEALVDGVKIVEDNLTVATFLQSVDADGNATNGIQITAEVATALKTTLAEGNITDIPEGENLQSVVVKIQEKVETFEGKVVDTEEARAHLLQTQTQVTTEVLAGKTFYVVGQDLENSSDIWGGEVTFKADMSSVDFVGSYGEDAGLRESEAITAVEGNKIVWANSGYSILGENKGSYLVFDDYDTNGLTSHTRLYFNKADADRYYQMLTGSLTAPGATTQVPDMIVLTPVMLNGKTFYDSFSEVNGSNELQMTCYARTDFTLTSGSRHEVCYDQSNAVLSNENYTFGYTIIDGKMRVDTGSSYKWFTLVSQSDTEWSVVNDDDDNKDGTIDSHGESNTWYLAKPANFPADL